MIDYFDDYQINLLFEQLTSEDGEIIEEGNIKAKEIGAPGKSKEKTRHIMITGSGESPYQGRMKVSKRGISGNSFSAHSSLSALISHTAEISTSGIFSAL